MRFVVLLGLISLGELVSGRHADALYSEKGMYFIAYILLICAIVDGIEFIYGLLK